LGKNLLRKAFTGIKLIGGINNLKKVEETMAKEYQFRKWFGKWRSNYLIKSQNNYLSMPPPMAPSFRMGLQSFDNQS
jgi:hypothetical protein